ncbi:oligosaccharide flippase family protein [Escherichia coli]|nr:oligosaccharide flippase family protein [Escherichia coli]WCB42459.1 oligosaccharide flippase family protein [Escherichia coli]
MANYYLKNSIWLLSEKIVRLIVNFISVVYLANLLGPTIYGEYSYLYSIGMIIYTISSLGLDNVTTRECINNPIEKDRMLFLSLLLRGTTFVVTAVIYSLFLTSSNFNVSILILSAYAYTIITPYELYYAGIANSKFFSSMRTLAFLLSTIAKIIFAYWRYYELVALAFALEGVIYILFSYLKIKVHFTLGRHIINYCEIKKIIIMSLPLFYVSMVLIFSSKIDQILILHFLNFNELGVFSVAISISSALCILPNTFTSAFYGKILNSNDNELICMIYRINIILGVVIIALSILFIPFIIESFFSPAYFNAADVITLLLFSNVFKSLGFAMNFVIIKKQKQKYSVIYFFFRVDCNYIIELFLYSLFWNKRCWIGFNYWTSIDKFSLPFTVSRQGH